MKILVVGSDSKGKTTFVKRMIKEKAIRGSSHSNLIFEMDEWTYSLGSTVAPVTFKIWNFNGKVSVKIVDFSCNIIMFMHYRNLMKINAVSTQSMQYILWCLVYKMVILAYRNWTGGL